MLEIRLASRTRKSPPRGVYYGLTSPFVMTSMGPPYHGSDGNGPNRAPDRFAVWRGVASRVYACWIFYLKVQLFGHSIGAVPTVAFTFGSQA